MNLDRAELRGWISDALVRHDRDITERGETATRASAEEIIDAVWGRLPLEVRRRTTRGQVQASLSMLTLRNSIALARTSAAPAGQLGPATATGHLGAATGTSGHLEVEATPDEPASDP